MWQGNELYYAGFLDLTSTRSVGFAPGPLSVIAILEYCAIMDIDGETREDFLWIVQRLDAKYLDWSGKKNGKPQ